MKEVTLELITPHNARELSSESNGLNHHNPTEYAKIIADINYEITQAAGGQRLVCRYDARWIPLRYLFLAIADLKKLGYQVTSNEDMYDLFISWRKE